MILGVPSAEGFSLHLSGLVGRSAIDVGANEGGYADSMLERGPRKVVAIEPHPVLARDLRSKYAADGRMVVRQEGTSDRAGKLTGVRFHNCWTLAQPGEFANRLSDISPGAEERTGSVPFDVELATLDAIVSEEGLSDLAFVKIDVDGYEARVLRGADHVLADLRPPMMIELSYLVQDLGDDVRAFVRGIYAHDYVLVSMVGEPATEDEVMEHYPWHTSFDVMMLPKEILAS